jgi:uncharacterized Tic20 family protein
MRKATTTSEKIAKALVNIMNTVNIIAFILLIVTATGMVEAWAITTTPMIICVSCIAWFIGISIFTRWIEVI